MALHNRIRSRGFLSMSADHIDPIDLDSLQRELTARIGSFTRLDGVHETAIAGLAAIRASAPSQPLSSVYEPSLCIVVQGRKHARLRDETYVYDPLNYLVVSVTLPVVGQIIEATLERPYLCLRISIDRKLIGELLLQAGPSLVQRPASERGLYVAKTEGALLDAVVRLVRLLDRPRDAQVLAPLIMREIHYRALTGELGARLRELCIVDSQIQRISRAIDTLRSRFADGFSVEDLAAIAHMSPSSFHHRFKEVTAMSPMQFQKQLRLHEARRLMLTEGMEASAAAHRVGYESPSQFSREYRRLFGAPPRQEIDALRA
jgi:AraC-like DNA-binding protein